jgi:hypothetical protein
MLTLGSKVNRSYGMRLPFQGDYVDINVFFNKTNTFIGFNPDKKLNDMSRNGKVKIQFFRDLSQSDFATTFLDLQDFKGPNLDIRCQFSNIISNHKDKIQYLSNESIKLAKVTTNSGTFKSCLYVYSFSFSDYEGDFIYVLAERQHIDVAMGKKLVRTGAIQIGTIECLDNMTNMVQYYNGGESKDFETKGEEIDSISDLLEGEPIEARKI